MARLTLFALIFAISSCGYRFGHVDRRLPGGFHRLAIPMFTNSSMELNVENQFTNALRLEFERSKIAEIVQHNDAQAILVGKIDSLEVEIDPNSRVEELAYAPDNTVLSTQYRLRVTVSLQLKQKDNGAVFWTGKVTNEKVYSAAQVTLAGINSANPLYNNSAKLENIAALARDMMAEGHDRITENF